MPVLRCAFCIAALSAVSSLAWADNIVVNNSTFSVLPASGLTSTNATGSWDLGPISGWTETGSGYFGQYQVAAGGGSFNSTPAPVSAFVTGGILSQDVGAVQAGETYTLSVDVGARLDMASTASIALVVNGVTYTGLGIAPAPGNWSTYKVTYTALAPDVGAQMYIELIGTGFEANFADVQLADAVPEPSTFALLLAGAAAIWFATRHRRSLADSRA